MEVKPGYKQTEVGVIPEEWEVDALGGIGRVIRGSSPRPKGDRRFYGGNVPRLMVEDVTRDRKYVTPTIDFLTVEGAKLSRPCKKGTLTVVCSGTPTVVGLPSILAVDACIHDGMLGLVHLSPSVESEYLFYRLTDLQEQLHAAATHGGTFVNLTTKGFGAFRIAVPPPPEQRAIAAALSDVDGLLGGLDRLIAKKRDLKQAAMQQLLTGQTRLPGFHGEWEVKTFGEVAVPRRERIDPRRTGVNDFCIELEHIESGSGQIVGSTSTGAQSSLKSVFHPGDVLFGKLRAYLRKYWRATRQGVCSTEIWVLVPRVDAATSEFLFQIVQTEGFIDAASNSYGTHMPRSDWNAVQNYELKMPSLAEQTAIAAVLSEMDGELAVLEQRREKTRALKQAMMQELLTGRTRLL